ncbi:MAG: hypothetical protein ACPGOY_18550 [Rhodospirillaceae bacterium]
MSILWDAFGDRAARLLTLNAPTLTLRPPPDGLALWSLHGDITTAAMTDALEDQFDLTLPETAGRTVGRPFAGLQLIPLGAQECWVMAEAEAGAAALAPSAPLGQALAAQGGAVIDQSPGWACADLWGTRSPGLLAHHWRLDLAPEAFPVGSFAKSLFGPIPMMLINLDRRVETDLPAFRLLVPRSLAVSFADLLMDAAAQMRHMAD